jgi:hypothetical protein
MRCFVFSWVHFFVEAGLLLALLDFNIGFEIMIAYLFQTDCGGRAAKNRKFLSQLAFFSWKPNPLK